MPRNRFVRSVATGTILALAGSLVLAGCGAAGTSVNKNLKIATDFPVSGGDASATLPAQYAVNLAVDQNKDLGNGYTLSVVNKDDEGASGADPSVGEANVQQLVNDAQVMAIVGPFNSGVAKKEIPVVNAATLVEISPTNTNPGLTLQQYADANNIDFSKLHPAGKPNSYFRIPANDVVQGKADATIALSPSPGLSAKTAFVVDDNSTYGKGLGDFFSDAFKAGGGTIVGTRASITSDQVANLPQLATTIKASNADVVFYGGVTSQGGPVLKKDLVAIGYKKPMVGGDGIAADPGFIKTAGLAAVGTIGTVAAPDTSTLTSTAAQDFKAKYTAFVAGKPNNDLLPYSAQAYDAAMIEITAIKNLIAANKAVTRAAVRDQVAGISYPGLTGTISFDANGDNAGSKVFAVYAVDPAKDPTKWSYETQINA
ncbi:MAG: branched-chain amino acid ABC transporter substrate-binding protein [Ktedonobacterales bacterium]|nr:branched-chain amino acid ABC transporter substrate-binding protein [Ktedonobacterales bacterium]